MPTVDVIAKAGFVYNGRPRRIGDVFPCEAGDLRLLRTIGKVEVDESSPAATVESVESADAPQPEVVRPKRRYRRRDLVAED